jgi:hypothetical protein
VRDWCEYVKIKVQLTGDESERVGNFAEWTRSLIDRSRPSGRRG